MDLDAGPADNECPEDNRIFQENSALLIIVIPIAPSVPSCSELSRCGLASAEYAARLVRRPTLTAPARAGFAILRVGTERWALEVEQKDREDEREVRKVS
jgi:hypothetical protein